MRHALGVLGVLAAGVLLAVSAAMNWRFGFSLSRTEFDGQIYGAASAAADCTKALVPFFFFAAWAVPTFEQQKKIARICKKMASGSRLKGQRRHVPLLSQEARQ